MFQFWVQSDSLGFADHTALKASKLACFFDGLEGWSGILQRVLLIAFRDWLW